ncbi:uncharacterized protein LOC106645425 [Copidosoma floridanum]|uniref:uncharacterized protein LOC106645425 n=1 Tax=Copidosoma floridanum TaxID=29053 RepID=UPI0006C94E2C|nr:uncharacterized protein LOC106645425 [Copidosoma floridanum]
MFRQIWVNRAHQDQQWIVWFPDQESSPIDYRLTTVTYGTNCAPLLAIRTLLQLADDEISRFSLGAKIQKENVYMDDMFVGDDTLSGAKNKRNELVSIFKSAGMALDKWAANQTELLSRDAVTQIDESQTVKTLGLRSISDISDITIPRWVGTSPGQKHELHGFSDALKRGYAAVVYLRVTTGEGGCHTHLLMSKTKVTPVNTISIPNLELCAAALLVSLIQHLKKSHFFQQLKFYAWTDSQLVLDWLNKHPRQWKTFVANRVAFTQTELLAATWSHVPSKENATDIASWLDQDRELWLTKAGQMRVLTTRPTPPAPPESDILIRFSTLTRGVITGQSLSHTAFTSAFFQGSTTNDVVRQTPTQEPLLEQTKPVYDHNLGILRVGGRLEHAPLPVEGKHPPIVAGRSTLARLFVRHAHHTCLHGGPTLTSSTVSQMIWLTDRSRLVKSKVRHCITCQKVKSRLVHQMMGDLPIRPSKIRGNCTSKRYIVLFVCFGTKAVHLELVSDLTSISFASAFRQFVSRSSHCQRLYSDNATTFHGADKDLRAMFHRASEFYRASAEALANDGTT